MNKDQVQGRIDQVKGNVKEEIGQILDDKDMEVEGLIEKNVGKFQSGFGDLAEDVKEASGNKWQ